MWFFDSAWWNVPKSAYSVKQCNLKSCYKIVHGVKDSFEGQIGPMDFKCKSWTEIVLDPTLKWF